jgi:hypothetical protein
VDGRGRTAAAAAAGGAGRHHRHWTRIITAVLFFAPPLSCNTHNSQNNTNNNNAKHHCGGFRTVLEGLDVVTKLENLGTRSGRTTSRAAVADSGELHVRRAAEAEWADEYGDE